MPPPSAALPPIPIDTVRSAEAVFGKGNLYLSVGDRASCLFDDICPGSLDTTGKTPATSLARLALVTLFQSAEGLSDQQASEAMRTRTDWKYALHVSMDHPGFSPQALCDFRQQLFCDAAARQTLQRMFDWLADNRPLATSSEQHPDVIGVMQSICTISRVDRMARAMNLALESIAAHYPEWLRSNTLPHWYERYNPISTISRQAQTGEGLDETVQSIGSDARYLVEAVAGAGDPALMLLSEVQALQREWYRQYEKEGAGEGEGDQRRWRTPRCIDCMRSLALPK